MALSEKLLSTLNGTFRKQRKKMDVAVWESVLTIKIDEHGMDSPAQEVNLDVPKKSGVIHIEYIHIEDTLEKNRYIRFGDIHRISNPETTSIMLELECGKKVKLIFGTAKAKEDFYEAINVVRASTQTGDPITRFQNYKHTWLDKLKELLDQQERILQQERNLQTLANWRSEKRSEPIRHIDKSVYQKPPPYDTDPQYQSILSREDMHKELNKMIQNNKNPPKKKDIEKLISDLISQLKEMETSCGGLEFPRSEIEAAGSQIKKIMEMHKKILELQDINKVHIQ